MNNIPSIGFGVGTALYKGYNHNIDNSILDNNIIEQVINSLKIGFIHLDLAEAYGNDREVNEGLKRYYNLNNSKKRNEIWITSKCSYNINQPSIALNEMLTRLNCDYLDLYLLHAPLEFLNPNLNIETIWREMESLVDEGLVRYIGVSNFRSQDLDELMAISRIKPYINQVEFNPYLQQPELFSKCQEYGILLSAYSPLGPLNLWPGGPLDPLLEELQQKYGKSASAILLKYTSQKGYIPITTTSKVERMNEYFSVYYDENNAFNLSDEDIQRIDQEGSKLHKRKYWAEKFNDSV